uniref:Uncharacterized protein n=1 Tax=Corethron hystrix TaxID=216773 RepID=A0A6U5E4E2_9STRA
MTMKHPYHRPVRNFPSPSHAERRASRCHVSRKPMHHQLRPDVAPVLSMFGNLPTLTYFRCLSVSRQVPSTFADAVGGKGLVKNDRHRRVTRRYAENKDQKQRSFRVEHMNIFTEVGPSLRPPCSIGKNRCVARHHCIQILFQQSVSVVPSSLRYFSGRRKRTFHDSRGQSVRD